LIKISHIINPVAVKKSSDLFVAQPVTFESMKIAKEFAQDEVDVSLFSAQYPEDHEIIPDWYEKTKDLNRSVLDYGNFKIKQKLPLIKDILDRLYAYSNHGDYIIYTNVDIALMPYFYKSIQNMIKAGNDAFIVNRRTIYKKFNSPEQIYLMFSEDGEKRPGYDCFVFKREIYPKFKLGYSCIGANHIGKILGVNLECLSNNFKIYKDSHLTFHIGDNRDWTNKNYIHYDEYNKNQLINTLYHLNEKGLLIENKMTKKYFIKYCEPSPQKTDKK